MILEQRFLKRVAEAMQAQDMNQSALARKMNVTRSMVSQYLTGHRTPGLDVVERFAKALDVDPLALLSSENLLAHA